MGPYFDTATATISVKFLSTVPLPLPITLKKCPLPLPLEWIIKVCNITETKFSPNLFCLSFSERGSSKTLVFSSEVWEQRYYAMP